MSDVTGNWVPLPIPFKRETAVQLRLTLLGIVLLSFIPGCVAHLKDTPLPLSPTPERTIHIMPLGDSITESYKGLPTYRYYLWRLAMTRGYRIDFIGSKHGAFGGLPAHTDFDMDHEGHNGWSADEILVRIAEWVTIQPPDIVLIHLGHNDLCQGKSVQDTVNDLGAIIDTLRAANPRVSILLAQVIASTSPCHRNIPALNAQIQTLTAKTQLHSPVVIVDQHTNFDPMTMTWDGIHPNAAGESHMAKQWFAALIPLL